MHAKFVMLWLQVVQPLTNVHETKWTPHVKQESEIAQSYTSSGLSLCGDQYSFQIIDLLLTCHSSEILHDLVSLMARCSSSAADWQTLNRRSLGSNPLCCHFEAWPFSLLIMASDDCSKLM